MDVLIATDITKNDRWWRPIGPYCLATEMRKNNIDCNIIHRFFQYSNQELENLIDKFVLPTTLVFGISSSFIDSVSILDENTMKINDTVNQYKNYTKFLPWSLDKIKWLESYLRKKSPNIKIVLGGTKSIFRTYDIFDYYFDGFSDLSFLKFVSDLSSNQKIQCKEIKNKKVVESITFPVNMQNKTEKWQANDVIFKDEGLPIEIARGCIFRCSYCSYPSNGRSKDLSYIKSKQSIIDELQRNYDMFGITNYQFVDDLLNDSTEKVEMIHDAIQSLNFKIRFSTYLRHDLFIKKFHTAQLLADCGLVGASFGIETLNDLSGKAIGKGLSAEKTKEILHKLQEIWPNVTIQSGFIVGLPHDNEKTYDNLFDWLNQKDCPINSFSFWPLYIRPMKNFNDVDTTKSKFETHPELWGYTLTDAGWENDHMNFTSAARIAKNLEKSLSHKNTVDSWGRSSYQLLDKTINKNTLFSEIKVASFIKDIDRTYYERLMSL